MRARYGFPAFGRRGANVPKVTLDRQALFALASDTRVEILRTLEPMRRTVTQIAEELGLDKAGVHRHLQKLVEGDLVQRQDDHGFVYYGLSWKGRGLLNPNENLKIVIHLALAAVLIGAAVLAVLAALPPPSEALPAGQFHEVGRSLEALFGEPADALGPGPGGVGLLGLLLAGGLAAPAVALLVLAWRRLRRPKQALATA